MNDIPIQSLFGLVPGRQTTIRCRAGTHPDRTPSFMMRKDGSYKCWGCGIYGRGAIDYMKRVMHASDAEILQLFK